MANLQIEGLIAATFTPLDDNGEINLDVIPSYVDHLVKDNIDGVFVNGTSGEGCLYSVEERKQLAEQWFHSGKNKMKYIIVNIGTECIRDTQELAKHAQKIGITCIAVVSPVYYKPQTAGAMAEYLQQVYKEAPRIPMLYYHIPFITHVSFSLESVFHAAQDKVPTLVGAKCSSQDLGDVQRCLDVFKGKYQVLYGGDEMILGACAMGATSSIGVSYNYAGPLARSVVEAFKKGDLDAARKYQANLQALLKVIQKNGLAGTLPISVHKAVMILKAINVGPPRLPLTPLSQTQMEKLKQDLDTIGYWDF